MKGRRIVHKLSFDTKIIFSNQLFHFVHKNKLCFSLNSRDIIRLFFCYKNRTLIENVQQLCNQTWETFCIASKNSQAVFLHVEIFNGHEEHWLKEHAKNYQNLLLATKNQFQIDNIDWTLLKSFYLNCIASFLVN